MKIPALGFVAKLNQSFAALACIWVQQSSLDSKNFAVVTLISNLFMIFVFLDFGISTRFIQSHFDKVSEIYLVDEVSLLRSNLTVYFFNFVKISFLHSLVTVGYCIYINKLTNYSISLPISFSIVIASFLFTLGNLVSKSLIACGKLITLAILQLIGILLQLILCVFGSIFNFSVFWFLLTIAYPNLFIGLVTLHIIKFGKLDLRILFSKTSDQIPKFSILKGANVKIQTLQFEQYAFSLIFTFLSANKLSPKEFASVMILFKVYQNLANSMSINGLLKWRETSINQNFIKKESYGQNINLLAFSALIISLTTTILISMTWLYIFRNLETPNISELIFWVAFPPLVIIYWNYYHIFLGKREYDILIKSNLFQIGTSLSALMFLRDSMTYIYPLANDLSLLVGMVFLIRNLRNRA